MKSLLVRRSIAHWPIVRPRLQAAALVITTILLAISVAAQVGIGIGNSTGYATAPSSSLGQGPLVGSVPSGTATTEVLRLTLRDAIDRALKYNLGSIENNENVVIARGQRLVALSQLLPQIGAGVSETTSQLNLVTLGIKNLPGVPEIVGPFAYSSATATISATLFSYESIQHFKSARTAEEAAKLSYQDVLDAVTLTVGNAYLQVISDA
ncbi:MAG TPA: TolC family protein, partial [Terriglobales bacterium]